MKHSFKTVLLISGLLLFSTVFMQSCRSGDADGPKTIILAHAMHLTHPVSIAMDRMAENIVEISDGNLRLEIYPAQQLGAERELLELVQFGTVGMTKVSAGSLENFVPEMGVFSLPYLFRDEEHMENTLWGDVGNALLDTGTRYRLKGIAYYDAGSRSIYTVNTPVHTPADLQGLKIRVMPSAMATRLAKTLGTSPTPIAYGELYTAFQGGIVDGAENNPPSFYTSRHYEVCNYYILNEHTTIPDVLVLGTHVWNNLTEQEQGWLMQAVNESVDHQRILWAESVEESMEVVEAAGVEIIRPDRQPFRDQLQPMYDNFRDNNPDLYQWVERIHQVD